MRNSEVQASEKDKKILSMLRILSRYSEQTEKLNSLYDKAFDLVTLSDEKPEKILSMLLDDLYSISERMTSLSNLSDKCFFDTKEP